MQWEGVGVKREEASVGGHGCHQLTWNDVMELKEQYILPHFIDRVLGELVVL